VIPKNDTPNKFWASIEPYCSDITQENLRVFILIHFLNIMINLQVISVII
jgi:hypothetical protein